MQRHMRATNRQRLFQKKLKQLWMRHTSQHKKKKLRRAGLQLAKVLALMKPVTASAVAGGPEVVVLKDNRDAAAAAEIAADAVDAVGQEERAYSWQKCRKR